MAELTPKQQKFCENVAVKKMTYSDAYRDAYNAENSKPESINVRASELMANSNISVRVQELQEETKQAVIKEAVYDYKAHMKELDNILEKAIKYSEENPASLNTAGKMVELKGKVSELYNFVQKTDNIGSPQVVVNNVTDAEALNELSSK